MKNDSFYENHLGSITQTDYAEYKNESEPQLKKVSIREDSTEFELE